MFVGRARKGLEADTLPDSPNSRELARQADCESDIDLQTGSHKADMIVVRRGARRRLKDGEKLRKWRENCDAFIDIFLAALARPAGRSFSQLVGSPGDGASLRVASWSMRAA